MKNKFNSLFIMMGLISSLMLGSSHVNAAYYYVSDVPDYHFIPATCNTHRHSASVRHHHQHHKHHSTSVTHAKRSHYSISTYYVYDTPSGNLLWVPSPCDCQGQWITARQLKTYDEFSHKPYHEEYNNDDMDYGMDMRTGDDVYP
jgi:hypothetical protein